MRPAVCPPGFEVWYIIGLYQKAVYDYVARYVVSFCSVYGLQIAAKRDCPQLANMPKAPGVNLKLCDTFSSATSTDLSKQALSPCLGVAGTLDRTPYLPVVVAS